MNINPTSFYIISGILVAIILFLSYIVRNLLMKVEKYEDVTTNQTQYLQNISNVLGESKKHLQSLDEKGVFQSDDEVGYFFEQMKAVQSELDRYILPENYGKKKEQSYYFTKETEEYIVKYNTSTDVEYRNKIFTAHIYIPFYKLAENIIHTFKFYYTDVEQIEDLKHEIVSVLLEEKISKFDPTNGAKAYSYFGTIVKRWLINYTNKNYKKLKQVGSFDDMEESYYPGEGRKEGYEILLSNFIDTWVDEMYKDIDMNFPKETERRIADAVLTIFKTRHDIDIFKKKALYIYIREMTDCDTPHLTKVISALKVMFYDKFQAKYDVGHFDINV